MFMLRRISFSLMLGVLLTMGVSKVYAAQADLKVGVVDFQRAINETDEGKRVEQQLNSSLSEKKKKFDILKNELEALRVDFEKQKLVLTGKPLDDAKQSLQNKFIEVEKTGATYEQELNQKKAEALQRMISGLQEIVQQIGKEGGYNLIFEKSQGVLFSSSGEDITDRVIKAYNSRKK